MEKENAAKFWSFFEPYAYDFNFNFDITVPCIDGSYLNVEFVRGYDYHSSISNVLMQSIRLAVTYKVAERMVQPEECKDPNDTIDAVIEDTLKVLETSRKIQKELSEVIVLPDAMEEYLTKPLKLRADLTARDAREESEIGDIASVRWLADNRIFINRSSERSIKDYCMRISMFIDPPVNKDKHLFHRDPGNEKCDIKSIYQAMYSNPPKNPYDNTHKINMWDWCKFVTMLIGEIDYRDPDAFK